MDRLDDVIEDRGENPLEFNACKLKDTSNLPLLVIDG
jgi:hypothetical protein